MIDSVDDSVVLVFHYEASFEVARERCAYDIRMLPQLLVYVLDRAAGHSVELLSHLWSKSYQVVQGPRPSCSKACVEWSHRGAIVTTVIVDSASSRI